MLKLRDLGHPDYLKITKIIRCNGKLEDAMTQVRMSVKVVNVRCVIDNVDIRLLILKCC